MQPSCGAGTGGGVLLTCTIKPYYFPIEENDLRARKTHDGDLKLCLHQASACMGRTGLLETNGLKCLKCHSWGSVSLIRSLRNERAPPSLTSPAPPLLPALSADAPPPTLLPDLHETLCSMFSLWMRWHAPSRWLRRAEMSPAQSLSSSFGVFGAAKEIIPSGRAMRAYT